ncbi:MAG: DUF1992 domain-containing protein [Anaerolineae bacterium]|nr:DUF1992 domain-containing protein [Anaerolineae bacterium]
MSDWGSYIDRSIRKAIEEGEFNNLPGEGKPLNLNDDPHTPDEMKLAYKILRENDLAPDWIVQGKDLTAKYDKLLEDIRRAVRAYKRTQTTPAEMANGETAWQSAQKRLSAEVEKLNREILTYNLKVPQGVTHRPIINLQREIKQLLGGL